MELQTIGRTSGSVGKGRGGDDSGGRAQPCPHGALPALLRLSNCELQLLNLPIQGIDPSTLVLNFSLQPLNLAFLLGTVALNLPKHQS
ncbi:unnamed protein product [Alopecurus aequalis]